MHNITDERFTAEIWDNVIDTINKVHAGTYTKAEALLEIHNDIDNWTPELTIIVDKNTPNCNPDK